MMDVELENTVTRNAPELRLAHVRNLGRRIGATRIFGMGAVRAIK